jgi:hypothetical protein
MAIARADNGPIVTQAWSQFGISVSPAASACGKVASLAYAPLPPLSTLAANHQLGNSRVSVPTRTHRIVDGLCSTSTLNDWSTTLSSNWPTVIRLASCSRERAFNVATLPANFRRVADFGQRRAWHRADPLRRCSETVRYLGYCSEAPPFGTGHHQQRRRHRHITTRSRIARSCATSAVAHSFLSAIYQS